MLRVSIDWYVFKDGVWRKVYEEGIPNIWIHRAQFDFDGEKSPLFLWEVTTEGKIFRRGWAMTLDSAKREAEDCAEQEWASAHGYDH